jgi:hypothetical protein
MRVHAGVAALIVCMVGLVARAQDMPDPSLINGRAIPASDLANGTVTVRVVREAIGNNMPGQQVRVVVGRTIQTATTDEQGRAEFKTLPRGADAVAEVVVEGETLRSQPFSVPTSGGLRVILVAGIAKATERKKQEEAAAAAAPAVKGTIVLGSNTRTLVQFRDDAIDVYYILEIINSARSRVDIGGPLVIELPREARGAATLEGSSPSATVANGRLVVTGPFASGTTSVQVGFRLLSSSGELTLTQPWPVALQRVVVGVQQLDGVKVSSPQFTATNEVPTGDGTVFILGNGPALPAGATTTVTISGLPFHSSTPRTVALGLAGGIAALGVWLSVTGLTGRRNAHQALVARRNTLLGQLTQLESKRRAGTIDPASYATRRQRLLSELERIYGELDEAGAGPEGGGEGVAA